MTRRLLEFVRRGCGLLSWPQRVGVVMFQAAWLVQLGVLLHLVTR